MAQSKAEICNVALSHIGVGNTIQDFDQDDSEEAQACRDLYDKALRPTMRAADWPFTRKFAALVLVQLDPTTEWKFEYKYPQDAERIHRILTGSRNPSLQETAPYIIIKGATSASILTDCEDAVMEYFVIETDPSRFTSDFELAFSYKLASFIAPRLADGDSRQIKLDMERLFAIEVTVAKAAALNEQQREPEPPSDLESARGGVARIPSPSNPGN